MRGYLTALLGLDTDDVFSISLPYAGITVLTETREEKFKADRQHVSGFRILRIGWRPESFLDEEEIRYLYEKYHTPEQTIRHMEAVAEYLEQLRGRIGTTSIDWERLRKAALVHDICRTGKRHAEAGGEALRKEGYDRIAGLVEKHHGNGLHTEGNDLSEAELLFYADKRMQETGLVTIDERFLASRKKCRTPDAIQNHSMQYKMAKDIEQKIEILMMNQKEIKNNETNEDGRCGGPDLMS